MCVNFDIEIALEYNDICIEVGNDDKFPLCVGTLGILN